MIYSLCSSSFCQGRKGVVVVEKDTHTFFFLSARLSVAFFFANSCNLLEYFLFYNPAKENSYQLSMNKLIQPETNSPATQLCLAKCHFFVTRNKVLLCLAKCHFFVMIYFRESVTILQSSKDDASLLQPHLRYSHSCSGASMSF